MPRPLSSSDRFEYDDPTSFFPVVEEEGSDDEDEDDGGVGERGEVGGAAPPDAPAEVLASSAVGEGGFGSDTARGEGSSPRKSSSGGGAAAEFTPRLSFPKGARVVMEGCDTSAEVNLFPLLNVYARIARCAGLSAGRAAPPVLGQRLDGTVRVCRLFRTALHRSGQCSWAAA
jgi:hypothetical protein